MGTHTHINVGLTQDQVEGLEEIGRVEDRWEEKTNDEEDSEVYRSVEHRPHPETGQIPAWGNSINPGGTPMVTRGLTKGHN